MRYARTVSRHARFAGYFACLLALVPVAASASWSAQITDVRPTGNSTPTHIETRVSSNYRFSSNDPRFYNRSLSLVSRQTVRTGALAALSRGVFHPGFQAAVLAAGFIISNTGGEHQIFVPNPDATTWEPSSPPDGYFSFHTYTHNFGGKYFADTGQVCLAIAAGYSASCCTYSLNSISYSGGTSGSCITYGYDSSGSHVSTKTANFSARHNEPNAGDVTTPSPAFIPASESDLEQLDPYLPDDLVREIYQADTYPEPWHESLDVSTLPLSQVASPNGQAAPEIFEDVAKWAENMTAQVNGEPEPHQGTNVAAGGNTAADEIVESIDENPPDDFPTVDDPVWVVDEIDELPDYDTGLTDYAQCRAPDVIEVPHFGTFELNWQPACDFATNISGPFKALGLLLGMFIVVGRR